MISPHSPWLSAHGKLWYDDKWYRYAWILWPQALAAVLVMWFWAMPSNRTATAQWAKPLDSSVRYQDLLTLRNAAKSSQPSMDALERDAHGGEMDAQFFLGTLYDPDLELSTIVAPDFAKAVEWYDKAASQGQQYALNNLALFYSRGVFTRVDYTRACYYALKLNANATGNGMTVKGDCYARGLGGTKLDPAQAASAYQAAPKGAQPSPAPSVPAPSPAAPSPPTPVPLIPGPAPASPTNSADLPWGAIGFAADGSYSTVWKMRSQPEAEADVAKQCAAFGRGGCQVASISGQQCVGLATFIGNYARRRWQLSYTAGGATYPEAQAASLGRCNADERTRGRCQFRTAVCADGR